MELDEALCDLHPLLGYICVHIGSPSRVCWFSAEHWRTYDVQSPADTNTALRHVAEKLLTETRGLAKTNKSEGLVQRIEKTVPGILQLASPRGQ